MTKLEELSELLVSEIKNFEEAVKKLEEIQRQKITIDCTNLELIVRQNQENIRESLVSHKHEMEIFGRNLEKAKAYPVWALIIFVVSLILNGIFTYVIFAE